MREGAQHARSPPEALPCRLLPASVALDLSRLQGRPAAGWRREVSAGFAQLLEAANLLMQALALALQLPEHFFRDKCRDPAARMCLFRYPPTGGEADSQQRGCGAHTDCGFLTFVAQDAPGIEVRWAAVHCPLPAVHPPFPLPMCFFSDYIWLRASRYS